MIATIRVLDPKVRPPEDRQVTPHALLEVFLEVVPYSVVALPVI
jgi:hypothetical protein